MDADKRRGIATLLRIVSFGLLAHLVYVYATKWPAGHPWYGLAHLCNAAAVAAISIRYSHPKWRSHAMIAALCLAGMAFVFAQQSEARYAAPHHE